ACHAWAPTTKSTPTGRRTPWWASWISASGRIGSVSPALTIALCAEGMPLPPPWGPLRPAASAARPPLLAVALPRAGAVAGRAPAMNNPGQSETLSQRTVGERAAYLQGLEAGVKLVRDQLERRRGGDVAEAVSEAVGMAEAMVAGVKMATWNREDS